MKLTKKQQTELISALEQRVVNHTLILDSLMALLINKNIITKQEIESELKTTVRMLEKQYKELNGEVESDKSYYYGPMGEA